MISVVRPLSVLCSVLVCLAQPAPPRYSITAAAGSAHVTGDNGPATSAILRKPQYIAIDRAGNLYISEALGYAIRKIAPDGTITTVAGTGVATSGPDGAQAAASPLAAAEGLALDNNGNLYLAELYLRKISSSGVLSTIAKISGIQGISFDQAGNLYVADSGSSRIRKIDINNTVTTIAGTGAAGFSGEAARPSQATQPTGRHSRRRRRQRLHRRPLQQPHPQDHPRWHHRHLRGKRHRRVRRRQRQPWRCPVE